MIVFRALLQRALPRPEGLRLPQGSFRNDAIGVGGCRHWDGAQEAEVDWLGAAMLVPRESALRWMLRNGDVEEGAKK